MGKVIINIDWIEKNFAAAPECEDIACAATGKTLDEVKKNIVEALQFHLEGMREANEEIPADFNGEIIPEFCLSTRAQLRYTENYITRKALAKETGINEQQLSHYANGQRNPRPAMQRRIAEGILSISRRLALIL